jgi:hypothetical protein
MNEERGEVDAVEVGDDGGKAGKATGHAPRHPAATWQEPHELCCDYGPVSLIAHNYS